jgi:lysophospholipase L1-like esterase
VTHLQRLETSASDPQTARDERPTSPTYHRYVAIGDSWTEGLGDPDPARPNGLRGWADRVAEVLATRSDDFGYANLAIRGRRVNEILEEQLEPALALGPDLISIQGGGNDFLRPGIDIDGLVDALDSAVAESVRAGAEVVLFTHGAAAAGPFRALRGRIAIFNELLREVVDKHRVVLVDNWRVREANDPRYWDADRVHLSPEGHHRAAMVVLDALGVEHPLEPPLLPDARPLQGRERLRAELDWVRQFAAPWVRRRLTGRSLGDGITAKRPTFGPI